MDRLNKIIFDKPYKIHTDDIIVQDNSCLIKDWFHLYINEEHQASKILINKFIEMEKILYMRPDIPKCYRQQNYLNNNILTVFCKIKILSENINIIIDGKVRNRDYNEFLLKKYLIPGNTIRMTLEYNSIWILSAKRLYGAIPKLDTLIITTHKPVNNVLLEDDVKTECAICFEDILEFFALVPCGHTQICKECLEILSENKCPICRSNYQSVLNVYLK